MKKLNRNEMNAVLGGKVCGVAGKVSSGVGGGTKPNPQPSNPGGGGGGFSGGGGGGGVR